MSRKKNEKELGKRCLIVQGDVSNLPYKAQQYDLVTAFETIYFWPELTTCFEEIRQIIKSGGQFMITCEMSDPSNTTWTDKIDGMTIYSPEDLKARLLKAGFASVAVDTAKREWDCLAAQN